MSMDKAQAESLGIEDKGKWLPFSFLLGIVDGCKLTSDDLSHPTYGCTTLFLHGGDTFIIDTPYNKFVRIWEEYIDVQTTGDSSLPPDSHEEDLNL